MDTVKVFIGETIAQFHALLQYNKKATLLLAGVAFLAGAIFF